MRSLLSIVVLLTACSSSPSDPAKSQPKAGETEKTEKAEQVEAAAKAEPASDAKTPPPLSEEDKRLIAMDPADLTPEMRRKRAYAMRRKIMQDPDSQAARTLQDLSDAYQRGELNDQNVKPTFSLPGTKPEGGAPPAGVRPSEPPAQAPK